MESRGTVIAFFDDNGRRILTNCPAATKLGAPSGSCIRTSNVCDIGSAAGMIFRIRVSKRISDILMNAASPVSTRGR